MNKAKSGAIVAGIVSLLAALPALAAPAANMMDMWGNVTINSAPAPVGTVIRAHYGSATSTPAGSFTVQTTGQYGSASGTGTNLSVSQGTGPITFTFQTPSFNNNVETSGTNPPSLSAFQGGQIVNRDLAFTTTAATSTPTSTPSTAPASHPSGTLVLSGGTIYLISNNQRLPFRNPREFFSYGYKFGHAVPANQDDLNLPLGGVVRAMEGTLALDTSDNRTVYLIDANGQKQGFTSAQVFTGLGFRFSNLQRINLSDYLAGQDITSATQAHPEGSLINNKGTVEWLLNGQLRPFSDVPTFASYGLAFNRVVPSNAADQSLPAGSVLQFRDGMLVNDGGTVYIISGGQKLPFTSAQAFLGRGYRFANVVNASLIYYSLGPALS